MLQTLNPQTHVNHSLNSLKGGYMGDYMWPTIGDSKGDTRSLDNGSCKGVPNDSAHGEVMPRTLNRQKTSMEGVPYQVVFR